MELAIVSPLIRQTYRQAIVSLPGVKSMRG
jgi:hypothetical protein